MIGDFLQAGFTVLRLGTQNEDGLSVERYYPAGPVKGRLRPLSGTETAFNEKKNYTATHRFYTDCFGIRVTDIIERGGEQYHVTHVVNPMEMDSHLQVDCELKDTLRASDAIVMSENMPIEEITGGGYAP